MATRTSAGEDMSFPLTAILHSMIQLCSGDPSPSTPGPLPFEVIVIRTKVVDVALCSNLSYNILQTTTIRAATRQSIVTSRPKGRRSPARRGTTESVGPTTATTTSTPSLTTHKTSVTGSTKGSVAPLAIVPCLDWQGRLLEGSKEVAGEVSGVFQYI